MLKSDTKHSFEAFLIRAKRVVKVGWLWGKSSWCWTPSGHLSLTTNSYWIQHLNRLAFYWYITSISWLFLHHSTSLTVNFRVVSIDSFWDFHLYEDDCVPFFFSTIKCNSEGSQNISSTIPGGFSKPTVRVYSQGQ